MPIATVDYDPFAAPPVPPSSFGGGPSRLPLPRQSQAPADVTGPPLKSVIPGVAAQPNTGPSGSAGMPTPGTIQNGYKFKGGNPSDMTSWDQLHGEDFLQSLPLARQAYIRGVVRGDVVNPSGFVMAKPEMQLAIAQAMQYDPTFSQTLWPTRVSMRQDVAKGKFGQNLNALNTAIQHTGLLADDIPKVWGVQAPMVGKAVNYIGNLAEDWSGRPGITQYRNVVNALSHELRRTYAQTGAGSQADLDAFDAGMGEDLSAEQKQAALKQQMQLLAGKANAIFEQYKQAMGPNMPPLKVLAPQSIAVLKKMGMNPTELGFHPSAWVPEAAIATLKANPKTAPLFDQHFGQGAAEQVLGE